MYTKQQLIHEIMQIRKEIGHEEVVPEIKEIHYNNDELTIITPDRPEKSIIIGKGGWVVGKLREKLGINQIHIVAYTDLILKEYQVGLSVKHVESLIKDKKIPEEYSIVFNGIHDLLKQKHEAIYDKSVIEMFIDENIDRKKIDGTKCYVALSGGADSSFSTIFAKALGFDVKCISVFAGTIILPSKFQRNINNLCNKLNLEHEYLETDMDEVIQEALKGNIHPCGQCSSHTSSVIKQKLEDDDIKIVIYGDLLSTGSRSIIIDDDIIRINLPALFRMEKTEIKNINAKFDVEKIKGYGCPLIVQVHEKYPQYKQFSIQRVLRETRSGILEPGEALELIKTI
ncbi:ATPase [Methanosphaera sp. BMS]|uniref:ATPase n=1 Tax=Methanosphaera sp. BMS TaxID=1789762 RepID=UPI000DC1E7FB|nr:ATPase [Methanosphaera sp. BMS]AWX32397.1 hypothetical protein AW729_04460 [Methanosphaera sp. BMS]